MAKTLWDIEPDGNLDVCALRVVTGKDMDEILGQWGEKFKVGPFCVFDVTNDNAQAFLKGEKITEPFKYTIARTLCGTVMLEVVKPEYGPSAAMDFLNERNGGIENIALRMSEEEAEKLDKKLRAAGVEKTYEQTMGAEKYVVYDSYAALGCEIAVMTGELFIGGKEVSPGKQEESENPKICQICITYNDNVEPFAKGWCDLLGIKKWDIMRFNRINAPLFFEGTRLMSLPENEAEYGFFCAISMFGNVQMEIVDSGAKYMEKHGGGPGLVHFKFFVPQQDMQKEALRIRDTGLEITTWGAMRADTFCNYESFDSVGCYVETGNFEIITQTPDLSYEYRG